MNATRQNLFALLALATLAALPACSAAPGGDDSSENTELTESGASAWRLTLGASYDAAGTKVRFSVFSARASRIELSVFAAATGQDAAASLALTKDPSTNVWSIELTTDELASFGVTGNVYYGYRAWGPNWTFDPAWTPGSGAGFVADVDADGNRFDPNKLLSDPYALELSHDPTGPQNQDGSVYASGPSHRNEDSARVAPKGIVIQQDTLSVGTKPARALKDDVIYEVHVRGFTMNDPSVPAKYRGTYAGASLKASYLKSLGVTAVEFLPVQETQNDGNDSATGTDGDNYWGYATLNYFAPERRFASDKTAGGPTREFKKMVKAFHDAGIKVITDVVYNHTGEGYLWNKSEPSTANVLSWRGLDNPSYYELSGDKRFFFDSTGCGGNFNTATKVTRDLIIDSLWYWKDVLGVDGFRFDLAPVLGNACESGCFSYDKMDPNNALNRAVNELGARPDGGGAGVDLIAEPWAPTDGGYQVGNFPWGWAEWNGAFRDTIRKAQNKMGVENVTPGQLATRFAGSSDLFGDDGRKPWRSVNLVVAHDGFTLRDLYSYNGKNNGQAWPFGPSDGGEDNNVSWDQGGDPGAQRQAARTGMALMMLSAGVPMIVGGDEMYRTQHGNNNAYNLDSDKNWLDWSNQSQNGSFFDFSRRLIAFRNAHPALRPQNFFSGSDHDGNGLKDIAWLTDGGWEADGGYMGSSSNHFLAYRIDGGELGDSAQSIYVAYNGWSGKVTAHLPANVNGKHWYRAGDTAGWMKSSGNFVDGGAEDLMTGATYDLAGRSVLVMVEN